MICFLALIVFSILGIFSAKHRMIAIEAFDCVFRKLTLRKCNSRLDQRLKSQITGTILKHTPKLARYTFKYFELISWIFTILLILSTIYSGISLYNFAVYGNCNGPGSNAFCIFDPLGSHEAVSSCTATGTYDPSIITQPNFTTNNPTFGNGTIKILEVGCYTCNYTKEVTPNILKLLNNYDVEFTYVDYPLPSHPNAYEYGLAGLCVLEQSEFQYWNFYKNIFGNELNSTISKLDINKTQYRQCLETKKYREIMDKNILEVEKSNIYGTPTIFINGEVLVGPKTYRELSSIVSKYKN